jgi:DNA-binding transcriptional MerR regulator
MTIQQLSQEIGIGIDTLRIWERRYGFPVPCRNARGHRIYSSQQVEELRLVKKLQTFGQRPGKIFSLSPQERRNLLGRLNSCILPNEERLQVLVEKMSPRQIAVELAEQLNKLGLNDFIKQIVIPLLQFLDHGWTTGKLSIARGHVVSDQLEAMLRHVLATSNPERCPQILFLTLSGERHKFGLLLAATLFQQAGLHVIWLRGELPWSEIPELVDDLGVTGVALSFSSYYAPRQAKQDLRSLRQHLDSKIKVIAGGQAVRQIRSQPNLLICTDLEQISELAQKHFKQRLSQEGMR